MELSELLVVGCSVGSAFVEEGDGRERKKWSGIDFLVLCIAVIFGVIASQYAVNRVEKL